MSTIDDKIKAALKDSGLSSIGPDADTVLADIAETFQGRYRFMMIGAWVKLLFITALAFFSIYQFFHEESVKALIAYAALGVTCVLTMATIYTVFWISLNHNNTLREVKRLELQVALLQGRIGRETK